MKKIILTSIVLAMATSGVFAQKYLTRTGKVTFDATTPTSPEKIAGMNNEVSTVFDAKVGNILFQVPVKSFKFKNALMQEHFNENYMESDKFPKADFKGNITNLSDVNFSKDGTYKTTVSGSLTIHGVTNSVTVSGTATVTGNTVMLKATFPAKLAEYKISVPGLVADKVAKEASVIMECSLTQK